MVSDVVGNRRIGVQFGNAQTESAMRMAIKNGFMMLSLSLRIRSSRLLTMMLLLSSLPTSNHLIKESIIHSTSSSRWISVGYP